MAFKLVKENAETEYRKVRVASQAYTVGDVVMLDTSSDSVDVIPATASVNPSNLFGVAMETVAATATELLVCVINPSQVWEATATNASNVSHNYLHMLLTNASSVNNTTNNTTDEAVFLQTGIISTTKIVGSFRNFNVASV
jgi:hypothetical protein